MIKCKITGLNAFIEKNINKWAIIVLTTSFLLMLITIIAVTIVNTDSDDTNFDYVIVGGGIEGAIMAYRLSNSVKDRILLIEAGPFLDQDNIINQTSKTLLDLEKEYFDKYFWQYRQPKPEIIPWNVTRDYTTGKGIGGDSAVDNLLFTRGTNYMFERWHDVTGDPIWDINTALTTFNTLEHYYGTDFDLARRGQTGYLSVTEEFTFGNQTIPTTIADKIMSAIIQTSNYALSFLDDYNNFSNDDWIGAFTNWQLHNNPAGGRSSTSSSFLTSAVKKRKNLVIKTDATALRVLFHPRFRASGVEYYHNSRIYRGIAAKEVILCAGPYTPAILQASGIGDTNILSAANIPVILHSPGVGTNISTQLALDITFSKNPFDEDSYSNTDLFHGGAFLPNPVINDPFDDTNTSPRKYMLYTFPKNNDELIVRLVDLHPNSYGTIHPISSNHLRPMNASDHIFEGLLGQHDLELMNIEFQTVICGMNAEFQGFGYGPPIDFSYNLINPSSDLCSNSTLLNEWIINNVKVHERQRTGGAAMLDVVNSKGSVIGISNLRIADSSIIPFGIDGTRLGPSMYIAYTIATQILLGNH